MAYFYVRTEKNKYDLDVIIDATGDADYVSSTSNLNWTRLSKLDTIPQTGSYLYDGKVITIDSEDYSTIEAVIHEKEELYKSENSISTECQELPEPVEYNESSVFEIDSNDDDDAYGDPRNLPLPMALPILGVEATAENYNHWWYNLADIRALISSLENNLASDTDNIATLNSAPEYAVRHDAHEPDKKLEYPYPNDTIDEYISFLKEQEGHMKVCVDNLALILQIDPNNLASMTSEEEVSE
jgi:hypothetical protein